MASTPPAVRDEWLSDHRHLGFDGRAHRHRVGARRMELGDWLEPDSRRDAQLAIKRELLDRAPELVTLEPLTPTAARGARRLEELLADAGAVAEGGPAATAIARCGSATQEDWCVMTREDTWRLGAASVCFPSRWVLAEKAGGTVASIHEPVPGYAEQLDGVVERVLDRLAPDAPVWRYNWNIWDDARLHQPREDPDASGWDLPEGDEVGRRLVLRVERQTLRRIDDDTVAFGIRVHQRRLGSLVAQPGAIDGLRATLDGLASSPSAAKKLGRLGRPVREWLGSLPSAVPTDDPERPPHPRAGR